MPPQQQKRQRKQKDGVEQNVYGDGYYQMEDQWYLPGYSNFPAGDEVKTPQPP